MERFINDDVKLKKGGRKAIKTTKEELIEKIIKRAQVLDEYMEVDEEDKEDMECYLREAIMTLFCDDDNIIKDKKFIVDIENMEYISFTEDEKINIGSSLVGFHTLENGFTFLGIVMGGDWEFPIFTILYFDGKKIRCYTPSYGNPINLDTKTAFGSECDGHIDFGKLLSKYKKLGLVKDKDVNSDIFKMDWSEFYTRKYGLILDEVKFNWNAIKEDILSRIEMI